VLTAGAGLLLLLLLCIMALSGWMCQLMHVLGPETMRHWCWK
jgi:hypothetical protein